MSFMNSEFPRTSFYVSDLRELIAMYKKLREDYDSWGVRLEKVEEQLKEIEEIIARKVKEEFEKQLPIEVKAEIERQLIKFIVVRITEAGYIVYDIPESWADIKFGTTVLDTEVKDFYEYGHLVLSYVTRG